MTPPAGRHPPLVARTTLRQGAILFVERVDPGASGRKGVPKPRPVMVLSANADISAGKPVVAVCLSGTYDRPPPADCVELPWHREGRASTGLRKPSVAVTSWLEILEEDQVQPPIGFLDAKRFAVVLAMALK